VLFVHVLLDKKLDEESFYKLSKLVARRSLLLTSNLLLVTRYPLPVVLFNGLLGE